MQPIVIKSVHIFCFSVLRSTFANGFGVLYALFTDNQLYSYYTVTSAVVDDKDTEWRTTIQFANEGLRVRGEKNCRFCGRPYKGGPDMILFHLPYTLLG